MRVNFTAAAIGDLTAIRRHIAADNPYAAKNMADRLIAACDGLMSFPLRGRLSATPPIRELTTVKPYIIAYRVNEPDIFILRIWHAAQSRQVD